MRLLDFEPATADFEAEIKTGLRKRRRRLSPKFFYDDRGSALFEQITRLPEYYLTRTEVAILEDRGDEIGQAVGQRVMLVEYGSGSGTKTRILLDHLDDPAAYVPIDISCELLVRSAEEIALNYPALEVLPVCADYTADYELPEPQRGYRRVVGFFPGSTIGNFHPDDAHDFLTRVRRTIGSDGGFVLGVDLKKDPDVLRRAYDDSAGVTAAFNLNLLRRINAELGGDFDLDQWQHQAVYNEDLGRIEMHLVSQVDQRVDVAGEVFHFEAGETIHTESSYKYALDDVRRVARQAGLEVVAVWTDPDTRFGVHYLERARPT